jgi:hypothetical protein
MSDELVILTSVNDGTLAHIMKGMLEAVVEAEPHRGHPTDSTQTIDRSQSPQRSAPFDARHFAIVATCNDPPIVNLF